MRPSNISMAPPPQFFIFFVFLIISLFSISNSTNIEPFIKCLNTHASPSYPISQTLYFPATASYSYILNLYARNLRFTNASAAHKPLLIIAAVHISHIQATVICAQRHRLQIRVRSGGHDFEGLSYVSDYETNFFVLDLFNFRAINVSVAEESAWVGAGATLGEVYYRISEKSDVHGFPAGMCPTVGVGGQLSGGGFGNLMRKHGLAADNVVDATVVDVNGRLLDRKAMGEDFFWAVTGGGAASFGVVVSYKIKLVRVPRKVTFAPIRVYSDNENFTDIVYKYIKLVDELEDDIYVKLAIDVVESSTNNAASKTLRATFLTFYLGELRKLVTMLETSFPELGLTESHCFEVSWVKSLILWMNFPAGSSTSVLLSRAHPLPARLKRKSVFLKNRIPKSGLELIFAKMKELETPILKFFPFGGIMDGIPESAKPFPHRRGNKALVEIATNWNETGIEAEKHYVNLTRELYECMSPFVSGLKEAYLNYRDLDLGVNDNGPNSYYGVAESYGFKYFKNNFNRLVEIKSRVDPGNFFRYEQSIPVFPVGIGSS